MSNSSIEYPQINIRSKNELAKQISSPGLSKDDALELINTVDKNYNNLYRDSEHLSKPEEGKYIRNAKGTDLGKLLRLINLRILKSYDKNVPGYIFGGLEDKNHVLAAANLLGNKRERALLAVDIETFFDQTEFGRVRNFFESKCGCSFKAASILAHICCVDEGPRNKNTGSKVLARGFATSPRLAIWCNINFFQRLNWLVKNSLKGHDPRLSIYVDDIGITASRVSDKKLYDLADEIKELLINLDDNQSLPLNEKKTRVVQHQNGIEHLGLKLYRNGLGLGDKTLSKKDRISHKLSQNSSSYYKKRELIRKKKSLEKYNAYIKKQKPN